MIITDSEAYLKYKHQILNICPKTVVVVGYDLWSLLVSLISCRDFDFSPKLLLPKEHVFKHLLLHYFILPLRGRLLSSSLTSLHCDFMPWME